MATTTKELNLQKLSKNVNQITLENINHKRINYNKGGWGDLTLPMPEKYYTQISILLGGAVGTQKYIVNLLKLKGINHWGLKRFVYVPKRDEFEYIAGQDYTAEIGKIRNYLRLFKL